MINHIRTLSTRFFTHHNIGPVILRIRAWAWLAAEADDLAEKERCLEAILAPEPHTEWAQMALLAVRQRRLRLN